METQNDKPTHRGSSHRLFLGVIAVFVGIILIASNLGVIPYHWKHIFFSWEMILIVIGIVMLAKNDGKPTGYILIGLGAFFLIPDLFYFSFDFVKLFWPLVLIFAGIALIGFSKNRENWSGHFTAGKSKTANSRAGYVDEFCFFGGAEKRFPNQEFKGGKITTIFGGTEIDFTQASLADGTHNLEITCIFGGITIIVPSDWIVVLDVTAIFGGFNDKRMIISKPENSKGELHIKGVALFGGGEIKSFI